MLQEQTSTSSWDPDDDYKLIKELWLNHPKPYKYISCKDHSSDFEMRVHEPLFRRLKMSETNVCHWIFTIEMKELTSKKLVKIQLWSHEDSNPVDGNFSIQGVYEGPEAEPIGEISNKTKWMASNTWRRVFRPDKYMVFVQFEARVSTVYRTNIIFDFGIFPFTIKKLCVDCTGEYIIPAHSTKDFIDLYMRNSWKDWHYDETDEYSIKENNMSKIYPFPEVSYNVTPLSSISTCREIQHYKSSLTNWNEFLRQAMHEALCHEEIEKQKILSKLDKKIAWMNMKDKLEIETPFRKRTISETENLYGEIELTSNLNCVLEGWRVVNNECDYVLVKLFEKGKEHIFKLRIIEKSCHKLYLKYSKYFLNICKLHPNQKVQIHIKFVLNRLKYCKWHFAVDAYNNNVSKQPISANYDSWKTSYKSNIITYEIFEKLKNLRNKPASSLLIMGSYSSGKKLLTAHMIRMFVRNSYRVLLCTKSNSVADFYIRQYFHDWCKDQCDQMNKNIKPIRIYDKRCSSKMIHRTVLDYCAKDSKNQFRDPSNEELNQHKLIVTTFSAINDAENMLYKGQTIHYLIVEEADRVALWECWDLELQFNKPCHVIYVGSKGTVLWTSIQTRLWPSIPISHHKYSIQKENRILHNLSFVYNMHPSIVNIVKCSASTEWVSNNAYPEHRTWWERKDLPLQPLTFYNVNNGAEVEVTHSTTETSGIKNMEEVECLVKVILRLKETWPQEWGLFNKNSIGIYTWSPAQVHALRSKLRSIKDITVENICEVYRMRHPVVFISTVQTKRRFDNSFTSDRRLILAAISRANYAVVVVGNRQALLGYSTNCIKNIWKDYITEAKYILS